MNEWKRPATTRRYLHPPRSERMYTLWREGKLIFGEIEVADYSEHISSGLWFFDAEGGQFDHRETVMLGDGEGIPIHGQVHRLGGLYMTIEAFADFGRASVCYIKIILENRGESAESGSLGFMLRTGREAELVFGAPDVYASYAPDILAWGELTSTWCEVDGGYTDGVRRIACRGDIEFSFDPGPGVGRAEVTLGPGEMREAVFAFNIGEVPEFDYGERRDAVREDWRRELARIDLDALPRGVREESRLSVVKSLTVQLLQCFCHPRGEDFLLCRQGGLQRQVWTFEAVTVLEALSRIGDFADYIEPVIDLYFGGFFTECGEIVAFAIPWARATATVLYSFASYALVRGALTSSHAIATGRTAPLSG